MRTFDFKTYQDRPFSKMTFLPIQTYVSEEFGRHFFIDSSFDFISAASLVGGGYDKNTLGYVSEWDDWEGVNYSELFEIYRKLVQKEYVQETTRLLDQFQ